MLALAFVAPGLAAQTATDNQRTLAANTTIELETIDAVSSRTSKTGDFFKLKVRTDVLGADGAVLIPSGTPAVGQVVHAARSGGGGKGGELILAARYVELPQGQVKLRSGFGAAGKARVGATLATSVVIGPFAMLIKGKDLELPAATPLSARLAQDTSFAPP
ncbi:MAG: hypothetical protein A3E01_08040 [Gammaproteobacteria bacterium RIFCSPHIGHO2_12_FULL_63_22]|nr:MAG: hypothetical protein A3E01_08040 [Gammaproteobacteria bacterium RIFCSPHIGHO2_12_FULL_63_22]